MRRIVLNKQVGRMVIILKKSWRKNESALDERKKHAPFFSPFSTWEKGARG